MNAGQRMGEIGAQISEIAGNRGLGSADKDVVPAGPGGAGHDLPRQGPQTPLGAVAGDGVADLLGTSEADANRRPGRIVRAALAGL